MLGASLVRLIYEVERIVDCVFKIIRKSLVKGDKIQNLAQKIPDLHSRQTARLSMKVIEPSVELVDIINAEEILKKIEICGRVCYQSEPKGQFEKFVRMLIKGGHESVPHHLRPRRSK